MTREQKIEWLARASVEDLLKQYETSARCAFDPFETIKRDNRYTFEEISENYELAKAEVLRRMGC